MAHDKITDTVEVSAARTINKIELLEKKGPGQGKE